MVTVDPASPEDADVVADLWVELAEGQREFGSYLLPAENRTTVRDAIAQSAVANDLLVAREEGEIVGFVSFTVESSTYVQDATRGVVRNIFVVPDSRGEGIGSDLLAEAERRLTAAGAEAIALEVMADNESARRFYRGHGYGPHRVELEKSVESDTLTKEQ